MSVKARRGPYPVSLLAEQSARPVDEIIEWLESGKLRGFKNTYEEWMVPASQMDRWRELCSASKKQERPVFVGTHYHPPINALNAKPMQHNHGGERDHEHDLHGRAIYAD